MGCVIVLLLLILGTLLGGPIGFALACVLSVVIACAVED